MPEEVKWTAVINNLSVKVILKGPWIKLVPILGDTPEEGIHIVTVSGTVSSDTHREFYNNGQRVGSYYPQSVVGGSLIATPQGAYTDISSGEVVRFVPMEPSVTQLSVSSASGGSICVSSPVSGWVVFAKYPIGEF